MWSLRRLVCILPENYFWHKLKTLTLLNESTVALIVVNAGFCKIYKEMLQHGLELESASGEWLPAYFHEWLCELAAWYVWLLSDCHVLKICSWIHGLRIQLRDVRMLTSDVKMKAMGTLEKAQSKKALFENSNKKLKDFIKEIRDFLTGQLILFWCKVFFLLSLSLNLFTAIARLQ